MRRLKLVNVKLGISIEDAFEPITVDQYTFKCVPKPSHNSAVTIYTQAMMRREMRVHKQNAVVEFEHEQEPTVIFTHQGVRGRIGRAPQNSRERKFIEDILLLGSIFSGSNWFLYGQRTYPHFPCSPSNSLEKIFLYPTECKQLLETAIECIRSSEWQRQYENGFHLRMLYNQSHVHNRETRFLADMAIWEWLYPHLKNPAGATPHDEGKNLHKIFTFVLKHFWGDSVNDAIFQDSLSNGLSKNIFYVLRNQLAHTAKLPIDREYAEEWMKQLPWEWHDRPYRTTIQDYLKFFDRLTQIIVLKTLGINVPESTHAETLQRIQLFLQTGKIGE